MGRTFQYHGLAKVTVTPSAADALVSHFFLPELPAVSKRRQSAYDNAVTFTAATIPVVAPDPRTMPRAMPPQLPTRAPGFRPWYQPATTWADIFTIPAAQRAYTCVDLPPQRIRRFQAHLERNQTGYPFFTIPIPIRATGGNEPLQFLLKRIGAAHQPVTTFNPPQTLPVPVQVYQSANPLPRMSGKKNLDYLGSDSMQGKWWILIITPGASFARLEEPTLKRRIRLAPDQPSFADSFREMPGIGGAFTQQQIPEPRKRIKLTPESSIFMRDFAAPAFCWSQASELPPKMKQRNTQGDCTPFGLKRNSPVMFGTEQFQPARGPRPKIVDYPSTGVPRTQNELKLGSFRMESAGPTKNLSSKVWLHWQNTMQFYTGPPPFVGAQAGYVDFLRMILGWWSGNGSGGGGGGTPCIIELIGTNNTVVNLIGTEQSAETTVELTGTDNTLVNLSGVC